VPSPVIECGDLGIIYCQGLQLGIGFHINICSYLAKVAIARYKNVFHLEKYLTYLLKVCPAENMITVKNCFPFSFK
jgi:hypothetical protein